ncbi:MAG: VOC family protein [Pseudonocardia sp.]|nr:VOC family protein [Pseudonocardia sp.]
MGITLGMVTIDCADPQKLAESWSAALNVQVAGDYGEFVFLAPPPKGQVPLGFQRVPEPKTIKNRVHLDVDAAPGTPSGSDERRAGARRRADELTAHGARLLRELDEPAGWCLVMADPEGNEFCLH